MYLGILAITYKFFLENYSRSYVQIIIIFFFCSSINGVLSVTPLIVLYQYIFHRRYKLQD